MSLDYKLNYATKMLCYDEKVTEAFIELQIQTINVLYCGKENDKDI